MHDSPHAGLLANESLSAGQSNEAAPTEGSKPSGGWTPQDPARVRAILGEGGCGLQFFLASELRRGMQWHFALLAMSCDARGQPVKVTAWIRISPQGPLCHKASPPFSPSGVSHLPRKLVEPIFPKLGVPGARNSHESVYAGVIWEAQENFVRR